MSSEKEGEPSKADLSTTELESGRHIVDVHDSFVDKTLFLDNLKKGVSLDNSSRMTIEPKEKPRFTFMNQKDDKNELINKRMSREEYLNYSTGQIENYLTNRLNERIKQVNRTNKSASVLESHTQSYDLPPTHKLKPLSKRMKRGLFNEKSKKSISPWRPAKNISITDNSANTSVFLSTPKFSK